MALGIVNGALYGFPFLSQSVFQYLCGIDLTEISVNSDDIPDNNIKMMMEKVGRFALCNNYLYVHR